MPDLPVFDLLAHVPYWYDESLEGLGWWDAGTQPVSAGGDDVPGVPSSPRARRRGGRLLAAARALGPRAVGRSVP